ncbi:MAG: exopolyphosphatase [Cryobacterium sp.]|nr:exopolyphosphatase [Cryobacterium sp.]
MRVKRVAAIDCGTNSIRLLIADVSADGTLIDLERSNQIVRLGHGVDRTGRLDPAALARTLAATREYAERIRALGITPDASTLRFVATSATRDAANRDEFLDGVESILSVRPEVVSGVDEAALSFRGAISALPAAGHATATPDAPVLVVDLGGGSTELVLGRTLPESSFSMNVGCVRLTERHVRTDPPSADELQAIRADVERALDEAEGVVDLSQASGVIGVAGTVTTITAHALGLDRYDPHAIHGAKLPLWVAVAAANELAAMTRAQRAALPYMHPGRVDVIAAGATVWATVLERVAAASGVDEVIASEHDILDGIALSLSGSSAGRVAP